VTTTLIPSRPRARQATDRFLHLSRADVVRCGLTVDEIADAIGDGFREKGLGRIESPPKRGVVPRSDSSIRAMMAHVPAMRAAGIKWIAAFPRNVRRGLPTISGVVVLNDVATGAVRAIMDASWITGARTAASTLVAARYLARPASETIGILACGLQGRTNLEALAAHFPLRRVKAYDVVPENADRFAAEMGERLGIAVVAVADPADVVRGSDIVVTSAPIRKRPRPAIPAGLLGEGAWACALDFDATFQGAAMAEADRLVTDDLEQLDFFRSIGYFRRTPQPDSELPQIAAGLRPGRAVERERIVSLNLGIGFLDIVTAELLYRRAVERGLGAWLEA